MWKIGTTTTIMEDNMMVAQKSEKKIYQELPNHPASGNLPKQNDIHMGKNCLCLYVYSGLMHNC